jgi:hypothetical protein
MMRAWRCSKSSTAVPMTIRRSSRPSTCLELDGEDWRPRPLEERKARLRQLLGKPQPGIQYSEHLEGDGAAIFAHACKLGFP